jgi:CubicO group peptidase (beta-lactamase class C family)
MTGHNEDSVGVWKMKKVLIVLISLMFTACTHNTAGPVPALGSEIGSLDPVVSDQIEELFEESGIPSMALAVVVGDELIWSKGFGHQPDLSTVYSIGSIDKSFTATAIMQLVEQGLIDLDDDVNEYLPFSVRHPDFPDTPVTIRMLLSHQSGLPHDLPGTRYTDNDGPMLRWFFSNKGRQFADLYRSYFPVDEEAYLEEVFSQDPKYGTDFWVLKPGTGFQYSNSGYYLVLGTIIEEVTGQRFQDYIADHILKPLQMENTSFEASDFPETQIAVPYENTGAQGYSDLPFTGANASGKLRTTAPDLARFLLFHMNQGELDDGHILEPSSVELMHSRIIPMSGFDFPGMDFYGVGFGWTLWGNGLQGHGGATPGYFAQMLMQESESGPYGVILMMTYGCSITECDFEWFDTYFVAVREKLLDHAEELSREEVLTD